MSGIKMVLEERRQVVEAAKGLAVWAVFDRKRGILSTNVFTGDYGGSSENTTLSQWEQSDKNPIFEGQKRYKVVSFSLSVNNSNWR